MHGESRLYAHTLMFWWTQQQHHLSQTCNKSFIFILFNTCTTHKRQRHSIWEEKNTQKIFQPYASIRYASYLPRMLFPLYNLHHHRTSVCYHCTLIRVTFFFLPIWCCSQHPCSCAHYFTRFKNHIYILFHFDIVYSYQLQRENTLNDPRRSKRYQCVISIGIKSSYFFLCGSKWLWKSGNYIFSEWKAVKIRSKFLK